jgi:DNA-binding transcriptional ArsR family regulator
VLERIALVVNGVDETDLCCLRNPDAREPNVRTLGDYLAVSRDLLDALAQPVRQDLVQLLARRELKVADIVDEVTLARPTVSHHLGILRRAGLLRVRKQGRERYYRLDKQRITAILQGLIESLNCC